MFVILSEPIPTVYIEEVLDIVFSPPIQDVFIKSMTKITPLIFKVEFATFPERLKECLSQLKKDREARIIIDPNNYITISNQLSSHTWKCIPPYTGIRPKVFVYEQDQQWSYPCILYQGWHCTKFIHEVTELTF
jgi:hypothetical protein